MIYSPNPPVTERKPRIFQLSPSFLAAFQGKQPNWGPVGYFTFKRTYARQMCDCSVACNHPTEEFHDTLQRVVEGCFNIQKVHVRSMGLVWLETKAQKSAQSMFKRMWDFKFSPPGRGLWMMGTKLISEKGSAALQNCFAGDTEVITSQGVQTMQQLAEAEVDATLLTTGGRWVKAPVRSFGKQKLYRLRLTRQGVDKVIYCTGDHRWFARDRRQAHRRSGFVEFKTTELRPGVHHLQYVFGQGIKEDVGGGKSIRRNWTVKLVEETEKVEEVYCATVEGSGAFALEGNILTGNCSFVSSLDLATDFAAPFCFLMDMSMLGVGVGGDTRGAGLVKLAAPKTTPNLFVVEDSREGWVDIVRTVLNSFIHKSSYPLVTDFSRVRRRGEPIKGFGGVASGPAPLKKLIEGITRLLLPEGVSVSMTPSDDTTDSVRVVFVGEGESYRISSTQIVDVFNYIGRCVVAGGIRRTAEIMFGDADDENFLNLKSDAKLAPLYAEKADFEKQIEESADRCLSTPRMRAYVEELDAKIQAHPLVDRRWASNNSIFAEVGMDYTRIAERIAENGEPGIFWLDNARRFGRMNGQPDDLDYRVMGTNPCGEISLESYEFCVKGDTLVQHRNGVQKIQDLVGERVSIWNGEGWSSVEPRVTGEGRKLFRVHLSDGSYLDCTSNHGWHVKLPGKHAFSRVETRSLVEGSLVTPFSIDAPFDGVQNPNAFAWGLFAGDGFLHKTDDGHTHPVVAICEGRDVYPGYPGYAGPVNMLNLKGLVPLDVVESLCAAEKGLVPAIMRMGRNSILEFMAGWIEAGGEISRKGTSTEGFQLYGSERKLRDAQVLLRRVGIDHAILKSSAGGRVETEHKVRKHYLYYLQIPSYECREIPTRFMTLTAVTDLGGTQTVDALEQKVVRVERVGGLHTTYCFDEPKNHMGVFGNVLTYQCNLVETYPAHHDSFEDYRETLKMAYLYAKTVTLVPSHDPRANAVMMRNRRIGCSMSGIVQARRKLGHREFIRWCDQGYLQVKELDRIYSEWLCVPRSIKVSTVKPSGTVSLLCGATPGIHFPHSEFYIRRVRVANTSPLVEAARSAGYPVESDLYVDDTSCVSFPVKEKHFVKGKGDATMWEQFTLAAALQRHWADNQVSVTISFKAHERKDIATCLSTFDDSLKAVSMLPLGEHGFAQAPYEEIDETTYLQMLARIVPLDLNGRNTHDIDAEDKFCSSDSCTLSFTKK